MPVRFLRVAVFTDSPSVTGCKGFLTRIDSASEKRWGGESAQLTFAPGEDDDALSKTIYAKVPAFLPRLHEIFSEVGNYVLTVVVTGDEISSQTSFLRFNWTQNWQTSFLTLLQNGQTW